MDYAKLIADAATKLNSLVNEVIDTLDKAGTPVNPMRIISDVTAKAFPEKDGVIYTSPEQIQDLEKEFGTKGDNNDTGTPYQSREEVPEQARELWDIMHGLRDDPHDDRWED